MTAESAMEFKHHALAQIVGPLTCAEMAPETVELKKVFVARIVLSIC